MTTMLSPGSQPAHPWDPSISDTPDRDSNEHLASRDVTVVESCHSTWVFDSRRKEYRRILKGIESAQRTVSTAWRPFWSLALDPDDEGFTVYLNPSRSRLIRSWQHTKDCAQCRHRETDRMPHETLQGAIPP